MPIPAAGRSGVTVVEVGCRAQPVTTSATTNGPTASRLPGERRRTAAAPSARRSAAPPRAPAARPRGGELRISLSSSISFYPASIQPVGVPHGGRPAPG
jgi:hypothetical protein